MFSGLGRPGGRVGKASDVSRLLMDWFGVSANINLKLCRNELQALGRFRLFGKFKFSVTTRFRFHFFSAETGSLSAILECREAVCASKTIRCWPVKTFGCLGESGVGVNGASALT